MSVPAVQRAVLALNDELRALLESLRRGNRAADRFHDHRPPPRRPGRSRPIIPVWALGFGLSQLNPGSRRPKPPGGGG